MAKTEEYMNSDCKIIAHRGNASEAPENTLPAFGQALEMEANGVELDVHLSRDGVPVVIHDERLERTTSGSGLVAEQDAAALTALDAGGWFDPPFSDVRIPLLAEVLDLFAHTEFEVHLELKTTHRPYPGMARKVAAMVLERGMESRVVVSSFHHPSLLEVREAAPALPLAALLYGDLIAPWEYALQHGFQGLHPGFRSVDAELAGQCRARGLALRPYTVDDPLEAQRLMALGVDGIITNVPRRMLALQQERGK